MKCQVFESVQMDRSGNSVHVVMMCVMSGSFKASGVNPEIDGTR